jgi:phosphate starvation-inducible PhoH-like protein
MYRDKIIILLNMIARTLNQRIYQKCLSVGKPIVIVTGPAGTGKTAFACHEAVNRIKAGSCSKIVLTRPLVTSDEELGFLPGNIQNKMDPWTRPMFDILGNYFTKERMNKLIEVAPLAYMRGRTFNGCFIIADEMQNSTPNQMKLVLTRIGEQSKMVVTGDSSQSDLRQTNGLDDLLLKLNGREAEYLDFVHLEEDDIQRHPAVKEIVEIYQNYYK